MIEFYAIMTGQWIERAPYSAEQTFKTRTYAAIYTVECGTVSQREAYLEIRDRFMKAFGLPSADSFSVIFYSLVRNERLN